MWCPDSSMAPLDTRDARRPPNQAALTTRLWLGAQPRTQSFVLANGRGDVTDRLVRVLSRLHNTTSAATLILLTSVQATNLSIETRDGLARAPSHRPRRAAGSHFSSAQPIGGGVPRMQRKGPRPLDKSNAAIN